MMNIKRLIVSGVMSVGIAGLLVSCGGSDGDDGPVFNPDVPPQKVEVVSGDRYASDVRNTISWEDDPAATGYLVYWSTTPGVVADDAHRVILYDRFHVQR